MSTYLYLIMHFILKLQKLLYPAFKQATVSFLQPCCAASVFMYM